MFALLAAVGSMRMRRPGLHAHAAAHQSEVASALAAPPQPTSPTSGPTVIHIDSAVLHDHAMRLGLNLGAESYYDSQQILKNLVSRNPGFEAWEWGSVMPCGHPEPNSCTGGPNSGAWPEGFLDGGTYEVISGAAMGATGTIAHSTAGTEHAGTTIQFAPAGGTPAVTLAATDYIAVRKVMSGDATGGWDVQASGGATVTTELKDLSPRTPGSQAVHIRARLAGQSVYFKQYFDGKGGHIFVQMRGPYTLRFRAKGLGGNNAMTVSVDRASGSQFKQPVVLDTAWRDYSFNFTAAETAAASGTAALVFAIEGADVLLDDVSLTESASNGTAFRNDVVATLERLKPGVLRYMDTGQNWGSTLDDLLGPASARKRSGFNRYLTKTDDIAIGLNDFLVLCDKIGAEPWFTMQMGISQKEAANLMEFLGGPVSTKYGATRAALGHAQPWTKAFPAIHLELGNEAWNDAQPGESMSDATAYTQRLTAIFRVMRHSPWYPTGPSTGPSSGRIDLVADGQAGNTYLNQTILEKAEGVDTIGIAPYTFNTFADDSSIEAVFGPMFAEPEMLDSSPTGYVRLQAEQARKSPKPANLAVYETNIDSVAGTVGQASLDAAVPSIGAGIASIEHMLLMLRDDGITLQNTYQLGGGSFGFNNTTGRERDETSPIWGIVIDMGGGTNRVRPSFLAQQLANHAIRPTMLTTALRGFDPKWDQPLSANDKVALAGAHELQSFAFTSKESNSLIVFNLSRTEGRTVGLDGPCAPSGAVTVQTLTAAKITDSNEQEERVKIATRVEQGVGAGSKFLLAPFSMTVLSAPNSGCIPTKAN